MVIRESHYDWLEHNFITFLQNLGVKYAQEYRGFIIAHGDKCYFAKSIWEPRNIPFNHGAAIYLLTYITPYSKESRETESGWVHPFNWVADNYQRFLPHLPK